MSIANETDMSEDGVDSAPSLDGVVIGLLAGIDHRGQPQVIFSGNLSELPIVARSTARIEPAAVGREVALLFEQGDRMRPVLIGLIESALPWSDSITEEASIDEPHPAQRRMTELAGDHSTGRTTANPTVPPPLELSVDGERVTLVAMEQMVLRCGKASITMTRAGKIIVRGAYVSTRSTGANRIKGGSVQIN